MKISDRGDKGAQNFNFVPKFPQNGVFLDPKFVFWEENCSKTLKLRRGEIAISPAMTTPQNVVWVKKKVKGAYSSL